MFHRNLQRRNDESVHATECYSEEIA
jgi:hypothetical protein